MDFIQNILIPIVGSILLIYFIIKIINKYRSSNDNKIETFYEPHNSGRYTKSNDDKIANILNGPGLYDFDVVGESKYQDNLFRICGGKSISGHNLIIDACLIHEDDNPYDNKAIRVDIEGLTVGYLPRKLAREFRKKMEEIGYPGLIASCSAMIVGGWDRGHGDEGHFGVKLDLPKERRKRKKKEV